MALEPMLIFNATRGNVVSESATVADRPIRRMRGLLGRSSLHAGESLLIQPAPSIHTAFMRFPIDVVFMDGTLRVVKVVEDLGPWRMASARRARAVLELEAGAVAQRGVRVGDHLGVLDPSQRTGTMPWDDPVGLAQGDDAVDPTVSKAAQNGSADASHSRVADRRRRVLVVAEDRRFRYVAATLLARRGFSVGVGERLGEARDTAASEHADVVVLDAGRSLSGVARALAEIEALDASIQVIIVDEDPEGLSMSLPMLPKWGSFDDLFNAIERGADVPVRRVAHERR